MNPWQNAVYWIQQNGGYVSSLLEYDAALRRVSVATSKASDQDASAINDANSEDDAKKLDASGSIISKGEVLMYIPDTCLLSIHSIENTPFGRTLFAAVHSLLPEKCNGIAKRARLSAQDAENTVDGRNETAGEELHNDEQDVVLALFLAYLMEQLSIECKPPNETEYNTLDRSNPVFYRAYLETLPTQEYLNLLPHQWSHKMIERCLTGTSLYRRALAEKKGLLLDYEAVKSAWLKNNQPDANFSISSNNSMAKSCSFPTFQWYNVMMSAVSSRAFAGLGWEGVDVMIPLLDLLNHVRGDGSKVMADEKRRSTDVRYERYDKVNEAIQASADATLKHKDCSSNSEEGGIKVTAARNLTAGTELHMTYGAKGNVALLGRYGFCIENNTEPDGSCNDVLEIRLRHNTKPIRLQRGPKSYSYSPFVEALSLFCNSSSNKNDNGAECESTKSLGNERSNNSGTKDIICDNDLEAFLDECDNESESDDNDLFDCYGDTDEADNESRSESVMNSHACNDDQLKADSAAVESLILALTDAKLQRKKNNLASSDHARHSVQEQFCLILIQSEIKTLAFFLAVAHTLKHCLHQMREDSSKSYVGIVTPVGTDECKEHTRHVGDVVSAFLAIRYSISSSK